AAAGKRGLAARFGGDEFTVVIEADDAGMPLPEFGWSLVRAFQQPLRLDGRDLLVSISVGAAFFPAHGADGESLLRAADAALFRAKAQGRGQLALFTPDLLEQASVRFTTEQGLRHAVERGEFELQFQPEIDLARREVSVCEALLRWRRADGELVAAAVRSSWPAHGRQCCHTPARRWGVCGAGRCAAGRAWAASCRTGDRADRERAADRCRYHPGTAPAATDGHHRGAR